MMKEAEEEVPPPPYSDEGYQPLSLSVDQPYISYAEKVFRRYRDHMKSNVRGE